MSEDSASGRRKDERRTADSTAEKQRGRPFEEGRSGNPRGRPKGSKNKLSEEFVSALCDDFHEHGSAVIAQVRAEKPDAYLKVIASILPKDLHVHTDGLDGLTDEELDEAIRVLDESIQKSRADLLLPLPPGLTPKGETIQ